MGTVIEPGGRDDFDRGEQREDWMMGAFRDCNEPITIQNY
jgi:hypothetical protein